MAQSFKSGFMAVIGRPNAGKSTILNYLVKQKLAAVSNKPQTTRHTIRAIVNTDDAQVVIIDTPGLHKPKDKFGEHLNEKTIKTLSSGVDIISFVIDSHALIGSGDCFIANQIKGLDQPKILLLSKIDLVNEDDLNAQLEVASHLGDFNLIIPISCNRGVGMDDFLDSVVDLMPNGPKYYPDDMITDQPEEKIIAEFIREKVCELSRDEVPHSVYVEVLNISQRKGKELIDIEAQIVVERDSQKGIVIGKGAKMLKEIGRSARLDIQNLLGSKVFLDLRVKVDKNWRKNLAGLEGK